MSWSMAFALACTPLGSLFRTLAVLWTQHRCSRVFGNTLPYRAPEAETAVADGQIGIDREPAVPDIQ